MASFFRCGLTHFSVLLLLFASLSGTAAAAEITLAGTLQGRAVFTVDGKTRTTRVGQLLVPGVRLLAVDGRQAVLDVNGRRAELRVGQRVPSGALGDQIAVLQANPQGHFVTMGSINGSPIRFLVDTGATMISLGLSDARRLGIDVSGGDVGIAQTAAGAVSVTRVRLEQVHVGDIHLDGIDALVHGNDLPVALLGMSFLNRTDMQREGSTMTLKKRY